MVPSAAHEAWHAVAMLEVRQQWKGKQMLPGAKEIVLTFYPKTHRRADSTNKGESVMDLLVDAGIIPDDNWFVVPRTVCQLGGVDHEKPRVEINIKKI